MSTSAPRPDTKGLRPEDVTRVFIRPLGSVLPLGFLVFACGAFLLSVYSLGWIPAAQGREVYELVLVFVVPVQAAAAVFAFLARDTAGGTSMGVFAATWASVAVLGLHAAPNATSSGLGVFLIADGAVILTLAIASIFGNPAFALLLGIACARFAISGLYQVTGTIELEHASGWIGLAMSVVALYAALAFLLEDSRHEPVLPFLRHGPARAALDADLLANVRRVESEPGVRSKL